jgi:uncharacterized membrane protein (UPF0127 family)
MSDHGTGHNHVQIKGFLGTIDRFITMIGSVSGILIVVAIIALTLIAVEFWPLWGGWTHTKNTAMSDIAVSMSDIAVSNLAHSGLAVRDVSIGGTIIHAFIANTDPLRERGLGGYFALARNEGMLFVFENDGSYGFWMKDTSFPIDIMWLSADGAVVYLQKNVTPETYPTVYISPQPARYVLELQAGFADEYEINIGTVIDLK